MLGTCRSTRRRSRSTSFSPELGRLRRSLWGLTRTVKRPVASVFVLYFSREDTEDAVKYISGTVLDDRSVHVDFDRGFQEGRQWGRGRSGGQVQDEYWTDYDPGRGGYGKLVQIELENRRQLVDYGTGSLSSFQAPMPSYYSQRKRPRDDDRAADSRRDYEAIPSDQESRPEKNPRFRESGDSDEEDDDDQKRRR